MLSFFQGGEIEETEIDRFFEFVDKISSHNHKRDVSLNKFNRIGWMAEVGRL